MTARVSARNEMPFRYERSPDPVFFPVMGLVILATVFIGFARSYYVAGIFRAPLPNLLVHIHGAVFSLWVA